VSAVDVLGRAAELLAARGWTPIRRYRSDDRGLTALKAITAAVDELAGGGPDSTDLHTEALDRVCMHVFGQRCGTTYGAATRSVSAWDHRGDQTDRAVIATLRELAA
jgi:hypothetical protein